MPLPPRKGAKAPDQLVSGTKADGYEQGPCTRLEDETPLGMPPRKGAKARQKFAKAPVPPEPPADGYEGSTSANRSVLEQNHLQYQIQHIVL